MRTRHASLLSLLCRSSTSMCARRACPRACPKCWWSTAAFRRGQLPALLPALRPTLLPPCPDAGTHLPNSVPPFLTHTTTTTHKHTSVPITLTACSCGVQDREDLCWWQPYSFAAVDMEGQAVTRQRHWLPMAVAVTADPDGWTVAVQEADSAEELKGGGGSEGVVVPPGGSRSVYELTAAVVLIRQARACQACQLGRHGGEARGIGRGDTSGYAAWH